MHNLHFTVSSPVSYSLSMMFFKYSRSTLPSAATSLARPAWRSSSWHTCDITPPSSARLKSDKLMSVLLVVHIALRPIGCVVKMLPLCQRLHQHVSQGARRGPNSDIVVDLVGKQRYGDGASDGTADKYFLTAILSLFQRHACPGSIICYSKSCC